MISALIVLGRGINSNGTLPPDPISRVKKAVELYREGVVPHIIMSGGYSHTLVDAPTQSEAAAMKLYAESLGIHSNNILVEDHSTHTLANAYFTKKLFCEPNQWQTIMVVASDEHLERAEYTFRKVYGPLYSFQFIASNRVISDEEYALELNHERASMKLTMEWLDGIKDGDDESIRLAVLAKYPDDTMNQSA